MDAVRGRKGESDGGLADLGREVLHRSPVSGVRIGPYHHVLTVWAEPDLLDERHVVLERIKERRIDRGPHLDRGSRGARMVPWITPDSRNILLVVPF